MWPQQWRHRWGQNRAWPQRWRHRWGQSPSRAPPPRHVGVRTGGKGREKLTFRLYDEWSGHSKPPALQRGRCRSCSSEHSTQQHKANVLPFLLPFFLSFFSFLALSGRVPLSPMNRYTHKTLFALRRRRKKKAIGFLQRTPCCYLIILPFCSSTLTYAFPHLPSSKAMAVASVGFVIIQIPWPKGRHFSFLVIHFFSCPPPFPSLFLLAASLNSS